MNGIAAIIDAGQLDLDAGNGLFAEIDLAVVVEVLPDKALQPRRKDLREVVAGAVVAGKRGRCR